MQARHGPEMGESRSSQTSIVAIENVEYGDLVGQLMRLQFQPRSPCMSGHQTHLVIVRMLADNLVKPVHDRLGTEILGRINRIGRVGDEHPLVSTMIDVSTEMLGTRRHHVHLEVL